MHQIFDRIMTGNSVCTAEINDHNAREIMAWVRDTDSHHDADNCSGAKQKDCVHAPGPFTVDWAATIVSEARFVCTCGEHGVDDPAEAARVIAEFRARWA